MCQISLLSALLQCIYFWGFFLPWKRLAVLKPHRNSWRRLYRSYMSFCRGNLTRVTRLTLLLKTSVSPDKYQKIAPCKGIQDRLWILLRGFLIPDSRYRISASLSLEQSLVGFGILELYSGFQSPGFQIPQAKISQIPWTKKTNKNTQTKKA